MPDGLQLSARSVAALLAQIFGPAVYDAPPFWGGGPLHRGALDPGGLGGFVAGPLPDPWRRLDAVLLNPQPLPPRESYAVALADAHLREVLTLDRLVASLGDSLAERALERAVRSVAELDEICPRWPRWPKGWPPPPPPPWEREEMVPTTLFVFGARFLAAADVAEHGRLQEALTALG